MGARADRQALLGHGHGALAHLAAHSRRQKLARARRAPRAARRAHRLRGVRGFCAELVAGCLQAGGLLNRASNPSAATPHSLYKLYRGQAAAAANPYTLRQQFGAAATHPLGRAPCAARPRGSGAALHPLLGAEPNGLAAPPAAFRVGAPASNRAAPSPLPRGVGPPVSAGLRVVNAGTTSRHDYALSLSLNSLNFRL